MLKTTELYYFSPTGGTKKTGEIVAAAIAENVKAINLAEKVVENSVSEAVVVAVPVFGGRIPTVVLEKLNKLEGKGKKAITAVVYGNRAYEDALLELNSAMKERGFQIVASAALVAQHSIVPEAGAGRPDEQDINEIHAFAEKALVKLEAEEKNSVEVPGNYPYKERKAMPATPVSTESCSLCGACAAICPTEAIKLTNVTVETCSETCILCMACVAHCPKQARILPAPVQQVMNQKLEEVKSVRNKNEFFL